MQVSIQIHQVENITVWDCFMFKIWKSSDTDTVDVMLDILLEVRIKRFKDRAKYNILVDMLD